ncbi:MAG: IclR family transcriptional regulator [Acidimicrobiales bacterium]
MARPSPQTDRVVALIELLSSEGAPSLTLAEVTRRLGVNKSTCHSMLTALQAVGWLVRDASTRAYRLGPALIAVGHHAASGFPAVELARPVMVEFARRHGCHCVALSIAGDRATVVDQVRDLRSPSSELPMGEIALRPPLGTIIYAWEDGETVRRWLEAEAPAARRHHLAVLELTRRRRFAVELATPPETRLRNLVAQLREGLVREVSAAPASPAPALSGTSIEDMVDRLAGELAQIETFSDFLPLTLEPAGEYLVSSLSVPVFDYAGRVVLSLSLLGFPTMVTGSDIERIGCELADATAGVTRAIGGRTPPPSPPPWAPPDDRYPDGVLLRTNGNR